VIVLLVNELRRERRRDDIETSMVCGVRIDRRCQQSGTKKQKKTASRAAQSIYRE
jgi:hypothetical protein